jgi:RND family efflux transporter MFP subunit
MQVRVQTVESKKTIATEEVVGTIRAKLHASIEAKVSARIEKMLVVPGQSVKAGDLLAQLDAREIQARLDQATAQRDQYARDTERLRQLLTNNAVSRQEFETVESRHRVAVAAVIESEALLGYAKITAPFSGVVTRKLSDVGDIATPGKSLLEMEDPTFLRLEADVPESLIGQVEPGAKLLVRVSQVTRKLQGAVSEIAPAADPASRTFLVKIDLPPTAGLRAGLFGRVAIPLGEVAVLRIPRNAIVQRGQLELVFVESNSQAQMRIVKTGKPIGDEVELVSGIEPGERVVVENAGSLVDGQRVEVRQ